MSSKAMSDALYIAMKVVWKLCRSRSSEFLIRKANPIIPLPCFHRELCLGIERGSEHKPVSVHSCIPLVEESTVLAAEDLLLHDLGSQQFPSALLVSKEVVLGSLTPLALSG